MTIIEVILPDGSIRAHLTAARDGATIAQEVRRSFPEASHWRIGRGWQGPGATRSFASAMSLWLRAALIAAVLVVATVLLLSLRQSLAAAHRVPENAAEAQPATTAGQMAPAADAGAPALASEDIVVAVGAEQASDTSRTLLVQLTNTGSQTHANIQLQAMFYDRSDRAIPGEQTTGSVTLAPGETASVKVWARSETGIERYELAILD